MSFTPHTTSVAATGATAGAASTSAAGSLQSPQLNSNDFLQLLMTELQNQNPMNPSSSDPTQFMTQLAQFTALEQQTNTAQATAQIATQQGEQTALALLGHTVTYIDQTTGATATGTVQNVEMTASGAALTINGNSGIAPASVTEVS